jgi:hypothetical protein
MKISDDKKIDLLSDQLQERYSAMHRMRERSMQFTLWILGLGLGLAWLSINETVFTCYQKCAITGLLIVVALAGFGFLRAIERGFNANRKTAIRIETALGLYEANCYGTEEAILPDAFSRSKTGRTAHFCTLYILVAAVLLVLLVFTWANPGKSVTGREHASLNEDKAQNSLVHD